MPTPREILNDLFQAAVAAADPMLVVPRWLPDPPRGKTIVIGAGKASARMALAFEQAWAHPLSGVVVTRYGHAEPCERIRILEAAHPVPDEAGLMASSAILDAVQGLSSDDLVVALMSGGGSALLPSPPQGLTLEDEQDLNRALLHSGLAIGEMNLIRQQASGIKGGRLAEAVGPARLVTLIISDVPGDDPSQVASGPTVPSNGCRKDALALIAKAGLALPATVMAYLHAPKAEAPEPLSQGLREVHVIATSTLSLAAAADRASQHYGLQTQTLTTTLEGEARVVGAQLARQVRELQASRAKEQGPVLLLAGGETTVTSSGRIGRGGRNTELALAFAMGLEGAKGIVALSADTDGIDGNNDAAGAFADAGTVCRLGESGMESGVILVNHDSGSGFSGLGDLLVLGPTRTNVNDVFLVLVEGL